MIKKIRVLCNLCHQEINLNKDNYCRHEDFQGKKHIITAYYHNNCFHNMINNMQQKVMQSIFANIPSITKEVKKQMEIAQ